MGTTFDEARAANELIAVRHLARAAAISELEGDETGHATVLYAQVRFLCAELGYDYEPIVDGARRYAPSVIAGHVDVI